MFFSRASTRSGATDATMGPSMAASATIAAFEAA
jgi:hypothetical protein